MVDTVIVDTIVKRDGMTYKCVARYTNGEQYINGYYQKAKTLRYTIIRANIRQCDGYTVTEYCPYQDTIKSAIEILSNSFRMSKTFKENVKLNFAEWIDLILDVIA